MNKYLNCFIAFVVGITVMAFVNSITLSFHSSGRIMVIIFAIVAAAAVGFIAYTIGRRRAQKAAMAVYNRGVERGRQLGRAEIQSEIQRFLEVE